MKSLKEILRSLEGLSDIELFVIDLFCGAGGLSEGVEEARLDGNRCAKVVCCVNHDKNAILSHDANIPDALHFIEDIRTLELSPISTIVERIRQLYPDAMIMLHASLECTNFSKAKGGQPRDADSRTLAEHLFRYIDVIDPDYIQIENVEEFMSWGDMDEKGKPISMDKGRLYQKWVRNVKKYGYNFEHRILNAADFGAYTTRKRFFGIFAKKSLPIVFPEPTHCKGGRQDMFSKLEKWKPVKEVLDFSDEGTTIFREKPLAEKTLERIYAGLIKFVAGGKDAFLVKYNSMSRTGKYNAPGIDEPCPVVATQGRLGVAQVCFLSKQFSGHPESKNVSVEEPAGAITCKDHHVFVSAYYGNGHNHSVDLPAPTVTTKDRFALVESRFLDMQYGNGIPMSINVPAGTVTTNPKFNIVTCKPWIMNTAFSNIGSSIEQPSQTITANRKWHVRVDFNQGLDARLVTDDIAQLLAKVKWIKRIRFGCDTPGQIAECERATKLIDKYGFKGEYFLYCIWMDFKESFYRVNYWKSVSRRFVPHCQPFRDLNNPHQIIPQWQKDLAHWADRKKLYMSCEFKDFTPRKGFVCSKYF